MGRQPLPGKSRTPAKLQGTLKLANDSNSSTHNHSVRMRTLSYGSQKQQRAVAVVGVRKVHASTWRMILPHHHRRTLSVFNQGCCMRRCMRCAGRPFRVAYAPDVASIIVKVLLAGKKAQGYACSDALVLLLTCTCRPKHKYGLKYGWPLLSCSPCQACVRSVSLCQACVRSVSPCQACVRSVSLCQACARSVSPCQACVRSVSLCQACVRSVSPCQACVRSVSPCQACVRSVSPCQACVRSVSLCQACVRSVSPCQACVRSVSPCQACVRSVSLCQACVRSVSLCQACVRSVSLCQACVALLASKSQRITSRPVLKMAPKIVI